MCHAFENVGWQGAYMESRFVLVLDQRAFARIIRPKANVPYFDSLFVREKFRRLGLGTELLYYTIHLLSSYPELDIRHQSTVAQRIAEKAGYRKAGSSLRYERCSLWKHDGGSLPRQQPCLLVVSARHIRGDSRTTTIYYLERTSNIWMSSK